MPALQAPEAQSCSKIFVTAGDARACACGSVTARVDLPPTTRQQTGSMGSQAPQSTVSTGQKMRMPHGMRNDALNALTTLLCHYPTQSRQRHVSGTHWQRQWASNAHTLPATSPQLCLSSP